MLEVGDVAPDFELLSDENEPIQLSDYRGQRVVLFFFPKAATPGCTKQASGFRDNFPVFKADNAVVFGISPDTPEELAQWKADLDLPYPLLSDADHKVSKAYDVWEEQEIQGNTFMGITRSHFVVGPDGKLEDVQYGVSPKKSVERAMTYVESA